MTVAFRDAGLADLAAIVRLLADDRLGAARERDEDPLPPCYAVGFAAMAAQGGRIVLALRDGAVAGCLQLNVLHGVSHLGQATALIEGVRVASALRGQGVGEALLRHAIAEARAAGCSSVQLTSNRSRTDAQRFYVRLGFVPSHVGMKLDLDGFGTGRE